MKRSFIAILLAALICVMLAGCGESKEEDTTPTVTMVPTVTLVPSVTEAEETPTPVMTPEETPKETPEATPTKDQDQQQGGQNGQGGQSQEKGGESE